MLLASAYITSLGAHPLDALQAAAAAGFDAVGLRLAGPVGHPLAYPVIGDGLLIRAIKARAADLGISILDIELVTLTADFNVQAVLSLLDAAAEFGARFVQVVSEDADEARACTNLRSVCDAAGERGLSVALEFMAFRALDSLARADAWLDRIGAPNAGILVDALHLARSGGRPADVAALDAGRIAFVQLCDAPATAPEDIVREARHARLYPGEGMLPLADLLAAAGDVPVSVEVPHRGATLLLPGEQCARAAQWTRAFLSGLAFR